MVKYSMRKIRFLLHSTAPKTRHLGRKEKAPLRINPEPFDLAHGDSKGGEFVEPQTPVLKAVYVVGLMLALILVSGGCASMSKPDSSGRNRYTELEPFKKNERILILAPHPDDESIACAGVIQKALGAGAQVRIVYLTNGDHNELAFIIYERRITLRQGEFVYLGKVRQKESLKAMKFLGLSEKDLVFLGYPDYGTFEIFCKYWQTGKPFS